MALWLVRAGSKGEQEEAVLESSVVAIGWSELPDLSSIATLDQLKSIYISTYKQNKKNAVANVAGQIWRFAKEIKVGDLVVLPLKRSSKIAIGRVDGPYSYNKNNEMLRHTVSVKWLNTDILRTAFGQDLLHSFGAFMTVCRIERNNAEERVKAVLAGTLDRSVQENDDGDLDEVNVEQNSRDQILNFISENFKGHDLTYLVAAILKTQGYVTFVSPPGPDGGIDILAGRGPMGFDGPHLAVQVKSSASLCDVDTVRAFEGAAKKHGADSLLFVSWGDFTKTVYRECKTSYFNLRLWTSDNVLDALFECYERLDPSIQAEIPLKRIWAVVMDEG